MQTEEFVLEGMIKGYKLDVKFSKVGTRQRVLRLQIESPELADLPPGALDDLAHDIAALSGRPLIIRAQTVQVSLPLEPTQPNGAGDTQVPLVK